MLVLKTINPIESINKVFQNFGNILWFLIGVGLIIFAIYVKIKDLKLKKHGIPIKAKVKNVEEIFKKNDEKQKIVTGYKTTFEFEYNGSKKEKTIAVSKKYKINSLKNGMYYSNNKEDILSISNEGFYLAKGGEIIMIAFGMLTIFLTLYSVFGFSTKIVIGVVMIFLILLFGVLYLSNFSLNGKSEIERKYYSDPDETSTVDESLVRYIPKMKDNTSKGSLGLIFGSSLFIALGGIALAIGFVSVYNSIKIKVTYPMVVGKISEIYDYESKNDEQKTVLVGVVYTYEIDGTTYTYNYETGTNKDFSSYSIGDTEKLYYEKEDYNKVIPKRELQSGIAPLMVGSLFVYMGIYFITEDKKNRRLYNTYVLMEEKKK